MKKIIFLILFLPFVTMAQENRIGKVSKTITAAKAISGEFQSFEIFNPQTKNATANYSEAVKDGVVVAIDQAKINELLDRNPKQMNLSIPFKSNGETITLDLIQVAVFSPDFKAVTNTGRDITNELDFGKHYRGVIAGDANSLVSISVFESQVNGFIANDQGNYTIGKLEDSDTDHIIYLDSDLKSNTEEFFCSVEDDGIGYTDEELSPPLTEQAPGDEIDVYVEAGQSVYNAFSGNLPNVVAFIAGIFTQSYVLYANDGILVRTSSMMVWVTPDPYDGPNSQAQLNTFRTNSSLNQQNLNGDIGHLIERQNYGGIAPLNGMCSLANRVCYSGLASNAVVNVPTYSWNVMVITHEMGHVMGSNHTHACVWNGNNTAIDGCTAVEGGCPRPGSPPDGGTIMSYCHFTTGINFTKGFGPQPTAVILNRIADADCLDPQDVSNPPVAVCKTHVVTLDINGEASITLADIEGGSYDNDGIVSMSIDIDTFDCGDVGMNNVTLTVTDTDGLTTSCTGLVEVIDAGGDPVISCPDDFTASIPTGTLYELLDYQDDITLVTATCSVTPAATTQSPNVGTQLPVGIHEITVNALLSDGSILSCSFDITVDNNLGLTDNSILSSLTLSPNPAVETLYLGNPENLELKSISIYDMIGRFIRLVDLKDMGIEQSIDVSELTESNYFVIIQGAQNKIIKQLIIK
jgi:hypothetical protein